MLVNICIVQESPVFFDKKATLDKMAVLVEQCSEKGANLVVFPESFIPGYPRGFSFGAVVGSRTDEGRELYRRYFEQSIDLSGTDKEVLEALAKKYGTYLVVGMTEQHQSTGSMYCSMAYISPKVGLLGVHRKIKPTGTERLIWSEAGGESLIAVDSAIGRLGGLICWENYMPMARMSMYEQGVQIYIAPTADSRESWIPTMRHIAMEGRCFVIGCNQYFERDMYPEEFISPEMPEILSRGGSVAVSPLGEIIAGPLFDTAGILHVEIDTDDTVRGKLDFDPVGHYDRPDIFELTVKSQPAVIRESDL